jgi:phage baseplate assembly protein W
MLLSSIEIPNAPYWQAKLATPGEVVTGIYDIAQAIETIFSTQVGVAPLMPLFGFNALAALGKPLRASIRKLERMAIEAFYWEPRAELLSVKASFVSDANVMLCLVWRPLGATEAVAQVVAI